jgi:predicted flap endonuclease-1-like 5' DNA nuclease
MSIPCFIVPIIVGIICAILGYLLGRMSGKGGNNLNLENDLNECKLQKASLQAEISTLKVKLDAAQNSVSKATEYKFDKEAALLHFGKKVKENDLTIIEGIGPKIAELFQNEGIKTWEDLSKTPVEKCKEILNEGGERFALHNPNTWPKQAEMAYKGLWEKLKEWQDKLDGGVEVD